MKAAKVIRFDGLDYKPFYNVGVDTELAPEFEEVDGVNFFNKAAASAIAKAINDFVSSKKMKNAKRARHRKFFHD